MTGKYREKWPGWQFDIIVGNISFYQLSGRRDESAKRSVRAKMHFWRITGQSEIDYVEESGSTLSAWELKWNKGAKISIPISFKKHYKTDVKVVNRTNFHEFLDA